MSENKRSIRILLLVLFILSLVSLMIGLLLTVSFYIASPYRDMQISFVEYTWAFFLVVPIPLSSVVLGFIYKFKGYRCLKNIIAGCIMIPLLCIYGSFTFLSAGTVSHDWNYLSEIESIVDFDFPNEGHITVDLMGIEEGSYGIQIKLDRDASAGFVSQLENNTNWKRDVSFMPANAVDLYTLTYITDYDYFSVYNITTESYNNFPGTLILMAYDVETRMIYIHRQGI